MQRFLRWAAAVTALVAAVVLAVAPTYSFVRETSVSVPGGGQGAQRTIERGTGSMLEANGAGVLSVLAIPLLAACATLLPWPTRFQRVVDITSALMVVAFCILGSMTVGLFFTPVALMLVGAALIGRLRPAT